MGFLEMFLNLTGVLGMGHAWPRKPGKMFWAELWSHVASTRSFRLLQMG